MASYGADVNTTYLYRLRDVSVGSQVDNQVLGWNAALGRWEPKSVSGVGTTNITQNSFTTNSVGKVARPLPTSVSPLFPLMVLDPSGSGSDLTIAYAPLLHMNNGVLKADGGITLGGITPGTLLQANGGTNIASVTLGAGLNFSSGTLSVSGNINAVTATNSVTIQTLKTNILSTDSTGLVTNTVIGAGLLWTPSTRTLSSTFSKPKSYLILAAPNSCDGAGAIIYTNNNTTVYFGQAAFSGSAATNANYIEYRITVPEDIDTSVDLKVERWKFRLGAADTGAHTYNIGMASVADSASFDSPTIGQWIALSFAGDASGASADVETVSNVTLTGWRSNVTAGQLWVIRVNRDGAGDASTQTSYSGPLVISYQTQ